MEHSHHAHIPRNDYGRFIAVILLFCLLTAVGYALQFTISCFLLSWVIAYLLDPLLVYAEKLGLRRVVALGALYVILGIVTVFFLAFVVPALTISWNSFTLDLPVYIQKTKLAAVEWKNRLPDRYGSEEIQWLIDKAANNIDTAAEKTGLWLYGFATSIFLNLFNVILSPILVLFMLYYKQTTIDTLKSWLPAGHKVQILSISREVNGTIGGYLRGQVVASIIVALLTTPALFALGVPHPIFCGFFAGAASILPFIGVIIATIPALFFAWFQFQSMELLGQTLLVFTIIYFVEGYVIKPLIFKESMNLNPLVTIIIVMAFGEILGFWGIMLALPIASAVKITWGHFLRGDFRRRPIS